MRIGQSIASGVLGARAFAGGVPAALLGVMLHFLIAFTAAMVFYVASRKLPFLVSRPLISGVLYGIVVYFFMTRVVVPLSAVPPRKGPFVLTLFLIGLATHIVCVGLPISMAVRRFGR